MLCPGLSNSVVRGSPWRVIGRGTIFFSGRPGEWGTRIPHLISLSLFEAFLREKNVYPLQFWQHSTLLPGIS